MTYRMLNSATLEEMKANNYRENSFEHRVLYLLANSDEPLMPKSIRDRINLVALSQTKVHNLLLDMKRLGLLIHNSDSDQWAISNKGLTVLIEVGHPSVEVATPKRTPKEKRAEVYERPPYDGAELGPTVTRAGAYDAFALPSRMNNKLHYKDGRVETIEGAST